MGATRPIAPQPYQPPSQQLDSQPPSQRRDQRDPRVRDDPVIVEHNRQRVQSDRVVILHHEGDLLTAGPGCCTHP